MKRFPKHRSVFHGVCLLFGKDITSFILPQIKMHIGIYAGEEAVIEFAEMLRLYKTSKGTIQIPYKQPLPLDLISKIAVWCYETGNRP